MPDLARSFPSIEGESLAGQQVVFPRDFAGGRTIALVAFDLNQRAELETWIPFIDERVRAGTARGRLFPVLGRSMKMMKAVVYAAMRKGAPSPEARAATVPLFVDLDAFCAALDIPDHRQTHVYVVESDGSLGVHLTGPYTAEAGAAVDALLKGSA